MTDKWNVFTEARPYTTVSGIAFDSKGNFPLLHRSENVRSARNCWSLPSGLHEVGLTMQEQFSIELREEMGLITVPHTNRVISDYENIRPDGDDKPGWHWVIKFMVVRVETLETLINNEPDKHDKIEIVNYLSNWWENRQWAPKLGEFIFANRDLITNKIEDLLMAKIP